MEQPDNNWLIDESAQILPQKQLTPPFGPVALDIITSCGLRGYFELTPGYLRKTDFTARIGSAFHRTLQQLPRYLAEETTQTDLTTRVQHSFQTEIFKERQKKAAQPREVFLPVNEERVKQAEIAVVNQALKGFSPGLNSAKSPTDRASRQISALNCAPNQAQNRSLLLTPASPVATEVTVTSKDKFFKGQIDRVELLPDNTIHIIDYKSATRADVPERYQKQLQLYAYLWYESFGQWPSQASLIYPFQNTQHAVSVEPQLCEEVAEKYRSEYTMLVGQKDITNSAKPGEVCKICEFRPWCKPFWNWQTTETNSLVARERASWGIEGILKNISQVATNWKLELLWRKQIVVSLFAPCDRFPHLVTAQPGTIIRALELRVLGSPAQPRFNTTETSEIFLVKP